MRWSTDFTKIPTNQELLLFVFFYDKLSYIMVRLSKDENGNLIVLDENYDDFKDQFELTLFDAWSKITEPSLEKLKLN
jgi:hypothetical protein